MPSFPFIPRVIEAPNDSLLRVGYYPRPRKSDKLARGKQGEIFMPTNDPVADLDPEVVPDTSLLITEDGKPVDNQFVEKLYRLLTEPLWTSWKSPEDRPFRVMANVGLFFKYREPPLVPDVMFAIDAETPPAGIRESDNRSYFVWVVGKPPDIVIEVVSDKRSREDSEKLAAYQRIKVPFYVIFDPDERLEGGVLRAFGMQNEKYRPIDPSRFGDLGLGLTLWDGEVEGANDTWLRWIDAGGKLVPNARERTDAELQRADAEKQRADAEKQRADMEAKRSNDAQERIKRLEEKLRNAGISANGVD
jgi:Uma2 family endonuclease